MEAIVHQLDAPGAWVVDASLQATVLILAVFVLRALLGRALSPRWRCVLWAIVAARLVLPALVASAWSPANAIVRARDAATRFTRGSFGQASRVAPAKATNLLVRAWLLPDPTEGTKVASDPSIHSRAVGRYELIGMLWAAGFAALLARHVARHRKLRRAVAAMPRVEDSEVLAAITDCAADLGLRRPLRVVRTDRMRSPAVWGVLRPVVILPDGLPMGGDELRAVLLHELAHLRRNDPLAEHLSALLGALHWFNPLVWLAAAAARADREQACDEVAVRQVTARGREPADYARLLLRVVERVGALPPHPAAIGAFGAAGGLRRRIDGIVRYGDQPSALRWLVGAAACVAVGCAAATDSRNTGAMKSPPVRVAPPSVTASVQDFSDEGPGLVKLSRADQETQAKMDRPLSEFVADAMPLGAAIDRFRDLAGVQTFVNWHALEAAGVSRTTPLTARLRNMRGDKTLNIILGEAARAGGQPAVLGWQIDEGIVVISLQSDIDASTLCTRVYDIRDLIIGVPDMEPSARKELTDAIITLIEDTIGSDSWKDRGGKVGAIRELSGQLIVTQTAKHHRALASLLHQLRETRAIQVNIESKVLEIDVERLPGNVAAMLRPPGPEAEGKSVFMFLTPQQIGEVLAAVQRQPDASLLAAPRVTLFNGQRARVEASSPVEYTSGYNVIKGAGGETRYEPVPATLHPGVVIDIEGTASADRKFVTLTLRPKVTTVHMGTPVPFAGNKDAPVDQPQVAEHEIQTTASIPDGHAVVLRTAPVDRDGKRILFMLFKPTLIVQREQ